MAYSVSSRLLLIVILPVIAVLVYIEGQNYDKALIRFQSSSSSEENVSVFFPREINGMTRSGRIRSFTKENLYEYINGHAEYFISSGFVTLSVGEYISGNRPDNEPDMVVDIYDMGTSIQAFGVISEEAGGKIIELQPGIEGYRSDLSQSFIKGQYYIRISAYTKDTPLDTVTGHINNSIIGESDPFPEFASLPDIGDVTATRFIKEDYRGLDFIKNVLEREYRVNGQELYIFVVTGNKKGINMITASFITFFRDSGIQFTEMEKDGVKLYNIKDPYEGDWVLIPMTGKLFGVFGFIDNTIVDSLIKQKG